MTETKAILLAGGHGTRLRPLTFCTNKHLLPVYDKPMIFYPLSVLMLADIRDVLIVAMPKDIPVLKSVLGDGSQYGMNFSYAEQPKPAGIAEAFTIGAEFVGSSKVCLILGDNFFYGHNLPEILKSARDKQVGGTVFGCHVGDPRSFGVVEFDPDGHAISIVEKPQNPRSQYAVTGLYFYDNQVLKAVQTISPSARGELEITDINNWYIKNSVLNVELLGRGHAWLDMGTTDNLLESSKFVATIQNRQGLYISCLEEIAYRNKWIDQKQLLAAADKFGDNAYGTYLKKIGCQ